MEKGTRIVVDASHYAIGGILMQSEKDQNDWRPVFYVGRKLHSYQMNYTVSEKECLVILIGIELNRQNLEAVEFSGVTDHHALCQLPNIEAKNGKLYRWSIASSAFRYKIIYSNGKNHSADCLSRSPNESSHRRSELMVEEDEGHGIFQTYFCADIEAKIPGKKLPVTSWYVTPKKFYLVLMKISSSLTKCKKKRSHTKE